MIDNNFDHRGHCLHCEALLNIPMDYAIEHNDVDFRNIVVKMFDDSYEKHTLTCINNHSGRYCVKKSTTSRVLAFIEVGNKVNIYDESNDDQFIGYIDTKSKLIYYEVQDMHSADIATIEKYTKNT